MVFPRSTWKRAANLDTRITNWEPIIRNEEILYDLYNSLQGPEWDESAKRNWFSEEPLDSWAGVVLDENGNIVSLSISTSYSKALGGDIPSSIGQLAHLKYLRIAAGIITSIPKEIGQLVELETLELVRINFPVGDLSLIIPEEIGQCRKLRRVSLSNHTIEELPDSFFNLTNLEELILSGDQLKGSLERFFVFSKLRILDVGGNVLSGPISREITNLKDLEVLRLLVNDFSGGIPEEISNLKHLKTLNLYFNRNLSGSIPESLGDIYDLVTLDLGYCNLEGHIPESLGNLRNLSTLYLAGNNLSGGLPSSLYFVKELGVAYNQLSGSIPDSFYGSPSFNERWGYIFLGNNFDEPDYNKITIPDLLLSETPTNTYTYSIKEGCKGNKMTMLVQWERNCPYAVDVMRRISNIYDRFHGRGLEIVSWSPEYSYEYDKVLFDEVNAKWQNRYHYSFYPSSAVPLVTVFNEEGLMIYTDLFDEGPRPGLEEIFDNYQW